MVTKLAIQELPSKDCRFLRIADNSWYNEDIPVECAILEITLPGKDCPVAFYVEKNFNTVFNSSLLEVKRADCHGQLIPLPDGAYKIKYSIKPNNVLYEEYYLLRNCQQLSNYAKAICGLFTEKFSLTKREFEQKVKELHWIKEVIDSAKYKVEDCGDLDGGLDLYKEASDLLTTFGNKCKSC